MRHKRESKNRVTRSGVQGWVASFQRSARVGLTGKATSKQRHEGGKESAIQVSKACVDAQR